MAGLRRRRWSWVREPARRVGRGLAGRREACECGVRVSWIIVTCMLGYGSLRLALWLRGQVRFRMLRERLPAWPQPRQRLRDLSAGLELLLDHNFAGRVALVESRRTIATVLITDPDAPLGCVRDFRYRVAVARAWAAACAWLGRLEDLADDDRIRLERAGYTAWAFRERHASLHRTVRATVRAPALEPFAVVAVEQTASLVAGMVEDLERVERALARGGDDPYR